MTEGSGYPVRGEVLSVGTAFTDPSGTVLGGVVEALRAESVSVRTE